MPNKGTRKKRGSGKKGKKKKTSKQKQREKEIEETVPLVKLVWSGININDNLILQAKQ